MKRDFRIRFWVEAISASLTGFLAVITVISPDWIEFVSGWDPDQHDGSVEQMILAGACIVTAIIFALAVIEWRRTPVSESA
jgi:hypothetical protein